MTATFLPAVPAFLTAPHRHGNILQSTTNKRRRPFTPSRPPSLPPTTLPTPTRRNPHPPPQCPPPPRCTSSGWSTGIPDTPPPSEIRDDLPPEGPPFLPQTVEYAIAQAQSATREALTDGHSRLRIELPMGRARGHWYLLSPVPTWYAEASILAFHYAEMFRGAEISVVLGGGPGVTHPVHWISHLRRLEDDTPKRGVQNDSDEDSSAGAANGNTMHNMDGELTDELKYVPKVTIFAAVTTKQKVLLEQRIGEVATNSEDAIIVLCSLLDDALQPPALPHLRTLIPCYICRAFDKHALMKVGHTGPWSVFIEIAVFEFEWVGDKPHAAALSDGWYPVQENLERFALRRGAFHKKGSVYLATPYGGCEAGFWPFMTVSCREVMPLDGEVLRREEEAKAEKKAKARPFGFF